MSRTKAVLGNEVRITDHIGLGALTRFVPVKEIDAVLEQTQTQSKRKRLLPAKVMVYYVMALALLMQVETREVLRWLLEGLKWLGIVNVTVAGKSGISLARSRLGWKPLQELYRRLVVPRATKKVKGAFYREWHLVSIDGSTMNVPDTKENLAAFKRPKGGRGKSAFPQIRLVALVENGTHILYGASMDSCRTSEKVLAQEVIKALKPGMLCLADRYYPSFELWKQALSSGADLLWRVPAQWKLPVLKVLSDGSYLSEIHSYRQKHKNMEKIQVRVIEYKLTGEGPGTVVYRLITSILDEAKAPAMELAALYCERWEIETALDELKTHLRGGNIVLRSKTPDLVRQEFYGLMLTHAAVRTVMLEAAISADIDPDRLSFSHTVRVIRRKLPRFTAAFSPSGATPTVSGSSSGNS